jgi:hypothetical protein
MSFQQMQMLSGMIERANLAWNKHWQGGPAVSSSDASPVELANGMRITLLSPRRNELNQLGAYWRKDLDRAPLVSDEPLVDDDMPAVSTRAGVTRKGSGRKRSAPETGKMNIEALAAKVFVGDKSVVNAASIAFLAEYNGKALLVGGDAHDSVLSESIRMLLRQRKLKRLSLDAFVIPHGGSFRNVGPELLKLLDCERYMVSTDGSKFQNPDRVTIARIITYGRAAPDRPLTLIFNYRSEFTEPWANAELKKRYRYEAIYSTAPDAGIKVEI